MISRATLHSAARCAGHTALIFALACGEGPSHPLARAVVPHFATAAGAVACERSWASATSGDWWDATRWTPAIVPTHLELVCFTASGSYTVTGAGYARHVYLTHGAHVTFEHTSGVSSTLQADSLTMQPTSRMVVARCQKLDINHVIVDGTLELDTDPATCDGPWGNRPHGIEALVNNGLLELDSAVIEPPYTFDATTFVNRGIVNVRSESTIDTRDGGASLIAGSLVGSGRLTISGSMSTWNSVWWGGTRLPSRATPTSPALLFVRVGRLALGDSSTYGAVDASVHVLGGNIGSQMDVTLSGPATQLPGQFTNSGTLAVLSNWVTSTSAGTLHNHGVIRALSGTPYQFLGASWLDNHGIIDVTGQLTLTSGSDVTNAGSVAMRPGALLKLDNATFEQQPSGTVAGTIDALGPLARISGNGFITSVRLDSGATLSPGTAWVDAGTLSFDTLEVNPGAITSIHLLGPAVSTGDRVHVTRSLSLGGTLALKTDSTYTGGVCGQLTTILSLARTATVAGSFASITGRQLDSARAWRLVPGATSYRVAGFDPRTRLSVAPAMLPVAEGGSAATASVCLGTPVPSASVTVTPAPRRGQVSATPSPLTFLTSNWELPQPFTFTAIDDTLAEGPHVDSVAFVLTSADPAYRGTAQPHLHVNVADNDPDVDLALSLVSAPATAAVGGLADLRFRITNAGPGNSTGSTLTLKPMAGLTLDSHSAAVSCSEGSGVLTCTIGAVAAGATLDVILFLRATTAGTHTTTARLAGRDFDPSLGNNSLPWVVTIS